MQKQIKIAAMSALLLLGIGCSKTDMNSDELQLKNGTQLNVLSAVGTDGCDVINFENVAPNTIISSVTSAGGVFVDMTSHNTSSPGYDDAAIVFNSSAPHKEDLDLGTPSRLYGGKGTSGHDQSDAGLASNDTALGNIVVIQNFTQYSALPYVANDDDNRDGLFETMTFDFSSVGTVTAQSINIIDVEESEEKESGWVILYDVNGVEIKRYPFFETWESGVQTIGLGNTPGVEMIKLEINGSIGFDNLRFCVTPPPPPPPPPTGCTRTQGYWKNHGPVTKGNQSNEWDVTSMMLGSVLYTDLELLAIFNTQPKKGNGLVSLAHQLIAAKLNIANGAGYTDAVMDAIEAADALIGSTVIPPKGSGFISSSVTSSLNTTLTMYNEGKLGTPHCDD